ncbi:hypothetical protein Droror1_Dr00027143 [Drosera rotundifolia]
MSSRSRAQVPLVAYCFLGHWIRFLLLIDYTCSWPALFYIFWLLISASHFSFLFEVVGIIRRKALIRNLAAVYHAECLAYCQQLLKLQKEWQETWIDIQVQEDTRKDMRPTKRAKKGR